MNQRRVGLQCFERIGDRLENFIVNRDFPGRLARAKLRVGDDHGEKVGDAAGDLAFGDKHRLVRIVEAGAAAAGHVGRREDPDDAGHGRGLFRVNLQNPRARMIGQHHRAAQQTGDTQIVDKGLLAQRLLHAVEPRC